MLAALEKKPISVAIAVNSDMAFYSSGTLSEAGGALNHGVVLVGYHRSYGFWIKNSWGLNWGYSGYAWIDKEDNARICDFATEVTMDYEFNGNTRKNPRQCAVC